MLGGNSMLSSLDVEGQLIAAGIPVSGSAIRDSESGNSFYVFVEVRRDGRGRQDPSNSQLETAKETLQGLGVLVDFVLTDAMMRDAEAGLRATLLHSFGAIVRNSFLAKEGRDAFVWVVPKRQLSDTELDDVSAKARVLLRELGLELVHVTLTTDENLPTKTRCLTMLRLVAPVTSETLALRLRAAGFVVPSEDWMVRRLDSMRKAGQVVRLKSGLYTVTLQTLRGLGTIKSRNSPDLSRLLALAKSRG
jgi:hypothetical protein